MPSVVKCIIYEARMFPLAGHKAVESQVEIRWATLQQIFKTTLKGPVHHLPLEKTVSSPIAIQQNGGFYHRGTTILTQTHSSLHFLRWDQDFRFEILDDDLLLQSPIELRVSGMSYQMIEHHTNRQVGSISIDLSSLLNTDSDQDVEGWYPIIDKEEGIRGQLHVGFKINFVRDENELREATTLLVDFFTTNSPPSANLFKMESYCGFVEELITFKYPRRQHDSDLALLLLDHFLTLRRRIAKKALKLKGNAILCYRQKVDFQFEKTDTLTIRGHGTIALLSLQNSLKKVKTEDVLLTVDHLRLEDEVNKLPALPQPLSLVPALQPLPEPSNPLAARRYQEEQVQLITNKIIPGNIQIQVGTVVHSRSVKLLHSRTKQSDRDDWWEELRYEIKQHALSQGCSHVFGYEEKSSIYEDLIVLSAYGTAAKVIRTQIGGLQHTSNKYQLQYSDEPNRALPLLEAASSSTGFVGQYLKTKQATKPQDAHKFVDSERKRAIKRQGCEFCHCVQIPKVENLQKQKIVKCRDCREGFVPQILLTTLDPPTGLKLIGQPLLVQAQVCREKSSSKEGHAIAVSEKMLFMEIDLHEQLIQKMKRARMNSLFSINLNLAVGENAIVGMATATALRIYALPLPHTLQIERNLRILEGADLQSEPVQENEQRITILRGSKEKTYKLKLPHDELGLAKPADGGFLGRAETMPSNILGGSHFKQNIAIRQIKEVDQVREESKMNQSPHKEIVQITTPEPEPHSPPVTSSRFPSPPILVLQNTQIIESSRRAEQPQRIDSNSEVDELLQLESDPKHILIGNQEIQIPSDVRLCNCEYMPYRQKGDEESKEPSLSDPMQFAKVGIFGTRAIDIASLFQSLFEFIQSRNLGPCFVSALSFHISFKDNHTLNMILRAVILRSLIPSEINEVSRKRTVSLSDSHHRLHKSSFHELAASLPQPPNEDVNSNYIESIQLIDISRQPKRKSRGCFSGFIKCCSTSKGKSHNGKTNFTTRELVDKNVKLVSLSFRPFKHVKKYIGFIDVFHVRELELGGESLELLQESFFREASEIMKARARGMGANCVLGYQLADFHIAHDSNNIICVICLTGNAALYDEEI